MANSNMANKSVGNPLQGTSMATVTTNYPAYQGGSMYSGGMIDPYYDSSMVAKRQFYSGMMDLMEITGDKRESLERLLQTTDTETMTIFKQLFGSMFRDYLQKEFKGV